MCAWGGVGPRRINSPFIAQSAPTTDRAVGLFTFATGGWVGGWFVFALVFFFCKSELRKVRAGHGSFKMPCSVQELVFSQLSIKTLHLKLRHAA